MSKGDTARTLGVKLALLRNTIRNTHGNPRLLQRLKSEEAALARKRDIAKNNEAKE